MATHRVELELKVVFIMDEMDGTPEESAEIAMGLVEESIRQHWDANAQITFTGSRQEVK